jgi:hypothetical protein
MSRKELGYPFANQQYPLPPSEHPFGSPLQFPQPALAPADAHYRNPSPPLDNPLQALTRSKEPSLPPNEAARTGTPNVEGRPGLLPSPMFRSSSRASVRSHTEVGGTAMELEDGARDDENDQSTPDVLSKSGTDSASV